METNAETKGCQVELESHNLISVRPYKLGHATPLVEVKKWTVPCDLTRRTLAHRQVLWGWSPARRNAPMSQEMPHPAGRRPSSEGRLNDTLSTEAPTIMWRCASVPQCPSRRSCNDDTSGQHHSAQQLHSQASDDVRRTPWASPLDRCAARGAFEEEGVHTHVLDKGQQPQPHTRHTATTIAGGT